MQAVDFRCPWGRPGDDCVYRKREAQNHQLHLQRLSKVAAVVDTSEPSTAHMRHLAVRARKKQNADEVQYKIATENRLLMAKMERIMREPKLRVSTSTSSILAKDNVGINEPVRRRNRQQIRDQNRVNARRLRELAPYYDRDHFEREHERSRRYLKNISRAEGLEQRLQSQRVPRCTSRGRRDAGRHDAPAALEASHADRLITTDAPQTRLSLRTAKQVRLDVSRERCHDLPSLFSSPHSIFNDRLPVDC